MIRVGKIVATHGLNGTLVMTHIVANSDWLKAEQVLFVAMQKDSHIPYFVNSVKVHSASEYHIILDEVDSVEKAKKMIGKAVFVKEEILDTVATDSPLLWIGFEVIDFQKGNLGKITDIAQTGHQWVASIQYEGKEVLLPMVKPILVEVNMRNKFINMDLPDGLLEI